MTSLANFTIKARKGTFGQQHERGPRNRKSLDKSKFKLRWHRASDHRAFNNTENVWANSCHGLPEQSDRKEPYQEDKKKKKMWLAYQCFTSNCCK